MEYRRLGKSGLHISEVGLLLALSLVAVLVIVASCTGAPMIPTPPAPASTSFERSQLLSQLNGYPTELRQAYLGIDKFSGDYEIQPGEREN